jgi:hypothetical protein
VALRRHVPVFEIDPIVGEAVNSTSLGWFRSLVAAPSHAPAATVRVPPALRRPGRGCGTTNAIGVTKTTRGFKTSVPGRPSLVSSSPKVHVVTSGLTANRN